MFSHPMPNGLRDIGRNMRVSFPWVLSLALGCCVVGCADDDDNDKGNTAGSGGSNTSGGSNSGGNSSTDRCHDGCVATLAVKCPVSPADQATCESDCHTFETGNCATEYDAFQDCAVGKPISCDNIIGFPIVPACETEQVAFMMCAEK